MPERFPSPASIIGAIVYAPDQAPEALMAGFAAELARRGFHVGGLVQETKFNGEDCKCAMEVVELDTGRRLSISQALGKGSDACSLDLAALADASGALRRGVESRVDLLFVNKYSKSEKAGGGLAAEMLQAMAEGVPLLTSVSGPFIGDWTAFTGGMGDILMPSEEALWRWWGPERLYDDLILGVGREAVKRVVIGLNWVLVEGSHGIGLAQTPERGTPGCRAAQGGWTGRPLAELAALARSWDPIEAAIGIAAINAHYNRFDLKAAEANGLEALDCDPAGIVVIGAFPKLGEKLPGARIVERRPGPDQYPEEAAQWLLPTAEGVVVTASTLVNRSLPGILRRCPATAPVALVGPGAPLTPRLFSYGVGTLAGLIATDPDGMVRAVAEGAGAKDLKRFGREAVIRA